MARLVFLFLYIGFYQTSVAQRERFPSYFGLQVRPIFPTRFIGEPTLSLSEGNFSTQINQRIGYSFGGTVRAGLTKTIAFETGINFNQRHFSVDMSVPDSGVVASNDLTFINYDSPINWLVYIQLSESIFMNASLGVALTYNPSKKQIQANLVTLSSPQQRFAIERDVTEMHPWTLDELGIAIDEHGETSQQVYRFQIDSIHFNP
jgi:hypothetical protein